MSTLRQCVRILRGPSTVVRSVTRRFLVAAALVGALAVLVVGPSNTAYTVKRVIGMPGEKVNCCSVDGKVQIDGVPLTEDYIYEDLPFGGAKQSGIGVEFAEEGLHEFTQIQVINEAR